MDFTIFYKKALESDTDWNNLPEYEVFISTFNNSDRVNHNFNQVRAQKKHWLLTPHHKLGNIRPKSGTIFNLPHFEDDNFIIEYFDQANISNNATICVDITGFIRPFIIYLFRYLSANGYKNVHVLYTEPNKYIKSEETEFSGFIEVIKTVPGCSAIVTYPASPNDVLIVAVGYDDKLIAAVSEDKKHCQMKYKIFGFPSLQPDMYQESVLQVYNARESLGNDSITLYSPAFDPFVTAQILKETIDTYLTRSKANFYLSPLSTKPQVLGFILYYIFEGINLPVNIIFPYSNHYSINNCQGIKTTWHYTIEFP